MRFPARGAGLIHTHLPASQWHGRYDPQWGATMTDLDTVLPVHPYTGLRAVGIVAGRPVWPILGGAPDDDGDDGSGDESGDDDGQGGDDDGDDGSGDDGEQEGADDLGDAGKRALDKMKQKWHAERERRRAAEAKTAPTGKTAGDGDGGVGQPDAEEIRREAEQDAASKANQRIVRSEVKAAAAGKLADPADAYRFLDLDQFEVDENGDVDSDEIEEAISSLLTNKPYLAAATAKRFQGSGDGGARKGSRPKQQITTREELAKLSPTERIKAHNEGRLKNLLES